MNRRERELIARAALGELGGADAEAWERLARRRPDLAAEAGALREVAGRLGELAGPATSPAAQGPEPVPGYILERLETARARIAAGAGGGRVASGAPAHAWRWIAAGASVALALVAVLALQMVGGRRPGATVAVVAPVFKAVQDPDLPVASPGPRTRYSEPIILWVTTDPAPVEVAILPSEGGAPLFLAREARAPLRLSQMERLGENTSLRPGGAYRLRVVQGASVSERAFAVDPAAAGAPGAESMAAGIGQARELLREGDPADALMLGLALRGAKGDGEPERQALVQEALAAALAEGAR